LIHGHILQQIKYCSQSDVIAFRNPVIDARSGCQ
jgi:hypothetical protein